MKQENSRRAETTRGPFAGHRRSCSHLFVQCQHPSSTSAKPRRNAGNPRRAHAHDCDNLPRDSVLMTMQRTLRSHISLLTLSARCVAFGGGQQRLSGASVALAITAEASTQIRNAYSAKPARERLHELFEIRVAGEARAKRAARKKTSRTPVDFSLNASGATQGRWRDCTRSLLKPAGLK